MNRGGKSTVVALVTSLVLPLLIAADMATACVHPDQGAAPEGKGGKDMSNASNSATAKVGATRVRLTVEDQQVVMTLSDNPTSKDFLALLPLKVKLSDHSRTEKIAYLPKKLTSKDAPPGYDPSVGDITYYAPWGNLAIFYKDFGYAKGLISLGTVESGLEHLARLRRDATVTIEIAEGETP